MKPIILPGLPQPMKLIRSNRCENCRWAEAEGAASKNFTCHRSPPGVGFVPTNRGPAAIASFPIVQPDQWCGEHQPKVGGNAVVDAVVEPAVAVPTGA